MAQIDSGELMKWLEGELKDEWLEESRERLGNGFWTGCVCTYERVIDKISEMGDMADGTRILKNGDCVDY